MGFFDRVAASLAEAEAKKRQEAVVRMTALQERLGQWTGESPLPFYLDVFDSKPVMGIQEGHDHSVALDEFVVAYIRVVGLRPEHTFGIYPEWSGVDSTTFSGVRFAYADRPEYEAGRARFADFVAQSLPAEPAE